MTDTENNIKIELIMYVGVIFGLVLGIFTGDIIFLFGLPFFFGLLFSVAGILIYSNENKEGSK